MSAGCVLLAPKYTTPYHWAEAGVATERKSPHTRVRKTSRYISSHSPPSKAGPSSVQCQTRPWPSAALRTLPQFRQFPSSSGVSLGVGSRRQEGTDGRYQSVVREARDRRRERRRQYGPRLVDS